MSTHAPSMSRLQVTSKGIKLVIWHGISAGYSKYPGYVSGRSTTGATGKYKKAKLTNG